MKGHVHIQCELLNYKKFNSKVVMSTKFQMYRSNTRFRKKHLFARSQSMYGNAITENVWARLNNCEFLSCYVNKQKMIQYLTRSNIRAIRIF